MNKKYEKIIKSLCKEQIFSFSGSDAVQRALKNFHKSEIIKETDKATLIKAKLYSPVKYEELVSRLIRTEYSIDQELAILRQRDEKPEEFVAYFSFAEQCKSEAKRFISEREEFYKK